MKPISGSRALDAEFKRLVSGLGGKSGGGDVDSPEEDPDTLQAKQWARIREVLSEGPIGGWVHPTQPLLDIYFDDTPVQGPYDQLAQTNGHTTTGSKVFTNGAGPNFPVFRNAAGVVKPNKTPWKGRWITGTNIPLYTTIQSVESEHSLTLSVPATGTTSTGTWQLGGPLAFKGVNFQFRAGTQGQAYMQGFPAAEVTSSVNVRVLRNLPYSHAFTDPLLDALRVDIRFPRLLKIDTNDGDVHGTSVRLRIRINGAVVVDDTVTGKSTGGYTRTYKVELGTLGLAPWTMMVERVTDDSTLNTLQNDTWVDAFTQVIYGKLRHPNSALVGLKIDAKNFSAIPKRSYHIKGLLIKIPSNYNPITHVYTGLWDGTFQTAWSNNPAWCWYDMVINNRYGLGHFLIEANIDKFALYTIGQYCDEMVPNGKGGTEPRFTCNLYIQKKEDAIKVLQDMAGIFRGMLTYVNGTVTPVQDSPGDPSAYRLFSPANVIQGQFNYSGVGMRSRHNVAVVSWIDLNDAGSVKQEYVEDHDGITKQGGINQLELAGFGCTSRAQARRIGLWAIYAEKILTDTISFATAIEGYFLTPGKLFQVQDPFRAGAEFSGRVKAGTTATHLFLDRSIVLTGGHTYTVAIINPLTGVTTTKSITTGAGTWSDITIATLGFNPEVDSMWQIARDDLFPEIFRAISVVAKDKATIEIVGLKYNDSLYDFVDFDHPLEEPPISQLPPAGSVLPPRPPLDIETIIVIKPDGTIRQDVELAWLPSLDPYFFRYNLEWRRNNGQWLRNNDVETNSFTILNALPGDYEFKVTAVNTINARSDPLQGEHTVGAPPTNITGVTGLEIFGGNHYVNGRATFQTRDCHFHWGVTSGNGPESPFGEDLPLETGTPDGMAVGFRVQILNDDTVIWEDETPASEYVFTWEKNKQAVEDHYGSGFGPLRIFTIKVSVKFLGNTYSTPATLIVENPLPPPPRNVVTQQGNGYIAWQWDLPQAPDIESFGLYASHDPDDDEPDQVADFHGTSGIYYLPNNQLTYYWLGTIDSFGSVSSNVPQGPPPGGFVLPPLFTPPGGTYTNSVNVTITEATQGCTIRYALTAIGANPTAFIAYSGPINIASNKTLHAVATSTTPPFESNVRQANYIILITQVAQPTFDPPGGFYSLDWPSRRMTVRISTATVGASLYWAFGRNPTTTDYDGFVNRNSHLLDLTVGIWDIRVLATKSGLTNSTIGQATYNIVQQLGPPCPVPTMTPDGGAFATYPVNVVLDVEGTDGPSFREGAPAEMGAVVWLEADSLLTGVISDGDPVNTWPDASGNGNDFQKVTNAPTFRTAPFPIVQFDGVNDLMQVISGLGLAQPITVMVVARQTNIANSGRFLDAPVGANRLLVGLTATNGFFDSFGGSSSLQDKTSYAGLFHVQTLIFNGASTAGWIDGVKVVTGSPGTNGLDLPYLGGDGGLAFLGGDIAAVLIFDRALSDADRLYLERRFATKYAPPTGWQDVPELETFLVKYTTDGMLPARHGPGNSVIAGSTVQMPQPGYMKAITYNRGREDSTMKIANFRRAAALPAPVFNPPAGQYPSFPIAVTIFTPPGAGINLRYTIDGSLPSATHGTLIASNTGVASVPVPGTTLKAVAFGVGYNTSRITSGLYTGVIGPPPVT